MVYRKHKFTVIGVLAPIPKERQWEIHEELDALVFITPEDFEKLGEPPEFDMIWVEAQEGKFQAAMREVQSLWAGRVEVQPLISLYEFYFRSQKQIMTSLTIVALIILIVSAFNVTNILSLSVASRVREIGIRRAVGATRSHIRRQLTAEALVLMGLGGLLGGGLAGLAGPFAARLAQVPVRPAYAHLGAAAVLLGLGVSAGLIPAISAGKWLPAEALGHRTLFMPHQRLEFPARFAAILGVAVGIGTTLFILAFGDYSRRELQRFFGTADPSIAVIHADALALGAQTMFRPPTPSTKIAGRSHRSREWNRRPSSRG